VTETVLFYICIATYKFALWDVANG